MDVSIRDDGGNFNYRVCAVMTDHDKILAMRDERSPFYYLPGGRVMIGETAEQAVIREVEKNWTSPPKSYVRYGLTSHFTRTMSTAWIIISYAFIFLWISRIPVC